MGLANTIKGPVSCSNRTLNPCWIQGLMLHGTGSMVLRNRADLGCNSIAEGVQAGGGLRAAVSRHEQLHGGQAGHEEGPGGPSAAPCRVHLLPEHARLVIEAPQVCLQMRPL